MALLHATVTAATPLGLHVIALHVHHGLSIHADAWLAHCETFCQRLTTAGASLGFAARRLSTRPTRGESIEAWARAARYASLREMALEQGASLVLLGHHQRDQAETLLLQALRGAGPAGLSGMPAAVVRDGLTWARPWLGQPREAIEAYGLQHRLDPVEDDSNGDSRYARNRLRSDVWPALLAAYPSAEASLANAARWAQEATSALAELAAMDLAVAERDQALDLSTWRTLSSPRRSNALRAWLRCRTSRAAPMALVSRLMVELALARPARWLLAHGELRSHHGLLEFTQTPSAPTALPTSTTLKVSRAGLKRLPDWHGALQFDRVACGGVALSRLHSLVLRARDGGEQFQSGAGRPPRPLKKQFQALGISAWEREGPLVYSGTDLLFVPGLGIDHRALASVGEPQMRMTWLPRRVPG